MYKTIVYAQASILDEIQPVDLDKIRAVAQKLDERGKFPTGLVAQPDVLVLQSVFLTTGRPGNLNDDVILNEEILPVIYTAKLKPFNIEHTKFIIGTIFDAFAINKEDGTVVPSLEEYSLEEEEEDEYSDDEEHVELDIDISSLPENLDIITNAALWKLHFPTEVASIKKKAIMGEMFVSMEVWFTDFDYLVGNRVVKRTPALSELLDSKLRINGGSGYLGLDKIKRIPRNLTLGGLAAVETPANPESFILDVMERSDLIDKKNLVEETVEVSDERTVNTDAKLIAKLVGENTIHVFDSLRDDGNKQDETDIVSDSGRSASLLGSDVSDSLNANAEVDEVVDDSEENELMKDNEQNLVELVEEKTLLASELGELKEQLADASKELEELRVSKEELEAKLEESLKTIEEKEAELAEKAEAISTLETGNTELSEKFEAVSAELKEIEHARKVEARQKALEELGLAEDRIVKILAKTDELDDEAFAADVEDLKAFISEVAKADEAEETPEEVPAEEPEVAEGAEEEVDSTEISEAELEEVLEEVEEEPAPAAAAVASAEIDETGEEEEGEFLTHAFAKSLGVNMPKNQ